eukprot:scaffold147615_cov14-Prasinocladus_malaysianus.AAC.2
MVKLYYFPSELRRQPDNKAVRLVYIAVNLKVASQSYGHRTLLLQPPAAHNGLHQKNQAAPSNLISP